VPLLPRDRLAKYCVFAAATCVIVGICVIKAATSADVIVAGGIAIWAGFGFGFWAHKLNPRMVRRFLDD
jgi:hypothetical protein